MSRVTGESLKVPGCASHLPEEEGVRSLPGGGATKEEGPEDTF